MRAKHPVSPFDEHNIRVWLPRGGCDLFSSEIKRGGLRGGSEGENWQRLINGRTFATGVRSGHARGPFGTGVRDYELVVWVGWRRGGGGL